MFALPPLPDWSALHPIAVHLPIGVLAAAPVLLIMSLMFGRRNKGIAGATLVLLLVGAAGCVLGTATGESAAEAAIIKVEAEPVLEQHEELAELARNIFLALAGGYLVMLLIAAALKDRLKPAGWIVAHIIYLLLYAAGLLVLINAGHLGGQLVHEYGVRADLGKPSSTND